MVHTHVNVKLDSKVTVTSCCHLVKQPLDVLTSTNVTSRHVMPMHNVQIMLAPTPVLVATDIPVMVTLVKISTNVMQPCLVANDAISKVTSFQPNHVTPMPIVSIKTVLSIANVTLDTLEMVLNVLISTNVSMVATTVMPMPPVPIPSVLGLAPVTADTMVTVLVVLMLTNASLTHVTLTELALTMMDHTPAPVMTASTVTVKHVLTSMSAFQLMPVMPTLPVPIVTVPTAVHVTVVTPVTVLPALIMMSVHSEQTIAMSMHHAPTTRVHLSALAIQDGKVPEMSALTSMNVLPKLTHVIHTELVPISMLPSNALVKLDMLVMVSLAPTSMNVSKLMLATLMLPVITLLVPMSAHVTPDTVVMDRPVLMMMNVSAVTTLVMPPSLHVPILLVHTNVHVTKDIKEMVWNVKTSMNAPTILATPMLAAPTMLAPLSALATTVTPVMVSTVLMITNVMMAAITVMPMPLVPIPQDHSNVLVTMDTLVMELIASITTNVLLMI